MPTDRSTAYKTAIEQGYQEQGSSIIDTIEIWSALSSDRLRLTNCGAEGNTTQTINAITDTFAFTARDEEGNEVEFMNAPFDLDSPDHLRTEHGWKLSLTMLLPIEMVMPFLESDRDGKRLNLRYRAYLANNPNVIQFTIDMRITLITITNASTTLTCVSLYNLGADFPRNVFDRQTFKNLDTR